MTKPGFCSVPGHQDIPARLYPCGWRCKGCAPGTRKTITEKENR